MHSEPIYTTHESFILRTPLYPFGFNKNLVNKPEIADHKLNAIGNKPLVQEAIYLASPHLFAEMDKWLKGEFGTGKKDLKNLDKLKSGLLRYLLRMSTRSTPFGLFAGFSTGNFGDQTNIRLLEQEANISHTRLDMNYLCALAQDLSKMEAIKAGLKFFPNSSIYSIAGRVRYVEYHYANGRRMHQIVAVDDSEYLQKILQSAAKGAMLHELAAAITDDEIFEEDARDFLNELIDAQLLMSELEPAVSGEEFLDQMLQILSGIPTNETLEKVLAVLNQVKSKLSALRNTPIGRDVGVFDQISHELKKLDTSFDIKYLFQTDMVKPTKTCQLDHQIKEDIYTALVVLNKLTPKNETTNLSKFREEFKERYEDEEIPLLRALDNENGIGYLSKLAGDISPLVDGLFLPLSKASSQDIKWNGIYALLLQKYTRAISDQSKIIELNDADLEGLEANWNDLPVTLSAMIQLFDDDRVQSKPILYVKSFGGSSGANLIGRFCHADKNAHDFVKDIISKDEEDSPNFIYAEIVHLPESRTGNILMRPIFRTYEIPYLAKSVLPETNQIKADDLYISVRGDQVFLRSKRLGKFVIPRLTTAHNFSYNSLPVYQFLCDMQTQNLRSGVMFSWGPLENNHRFLPRVMYKNIILARAKWNIQNKDIAHVLKLNKDNERTDAFMQFATQNNLPDEVLLADSDNELFLNLTNTNCVMILLDLIKNRQFFTLKEFLFSDYGFVAKGPDGFYTNEIVVALHKNEIPQAISQNIDSKIIT
jgi:lantibiotic biosynthesis protein